MIIHSKLFSQSIPKKTLAKYIIEEMTKTNDSKHLLLHGRYQGHFKDALVHSPGCIPFGVERSNRDRAVVPSLPKKRAALYPGPPEIG